MSTNNVSGNPQRGSSGSEGMLLVCCAIIEHAGKTLAVQRGEQMDLPLKWEFPGGKVKPNEAETLCVIRCATRRVFIYTYYEEKT